MISLMSLWLPVLLSAVVVFIISSLIHTVLHYHNTDMRKLPNEERVADSLRGLDTPDGVYVIPHAGGMAEMKSPEFKAKFEKGPIAIITLAKSGGNMSMAPHMLQWFCYCLVVSIFAAYIASRALAPGAPYLSVFRFAGATAFFCYGVAIWQESIWMRRPWSTTTKNTIDALVYGLFTAGVFGWLWPQV